MTQLSKSKKNWHWIVGLILSLTALSDKAFPISRIGNGKYSVKNNTLSAQDFSFKIPEKFSCKMENGACGKLESLTPDVTQKLSFTTPYVQVVPIESGYPELKTGDPKAMEKFFGESDKAKFNFVKVKTEDCYDVYMGTGDNAYNAVVTIKNKSGFILVSPQGQATEKAIQDILSTLKVEGKCERNQNKGK